MASKKTSTGAGSRASTIQQHLTYAAHAFAEEILRILSGSTLAELTTLTGHQYESDVGAAPIATRAARTARVATAKSSAKAPEEKKRPSPRTSALRRLAGTKPVTCPVSGCTNPGIRSKMNFCNDHAGSLPKAEKVKLRHAQRAAHLAALKAGGAEQAEEKPAKKSKKKAA